MGKDAPVVGYNTPLNSGTFDQFEDYVDPFGIFHGNPEDETDFNEQVAKLDPTKGKQVVQPPNREAANKEGLKSARDEARRRASRTLFTGSQGVLDSPAPASNILLGI